MCDIVLYYALTPKKFGASASHGICLTDDLLLSVPASLALLHFRDTLENELQIRMDR